MTDTHTDNDTLDLTPGMEADAHLAEAEGHDKWAGPDDDQELDLEIEGEDAGDDTPVVRELRQRNRDQARELSQLRQARQSQQPQTIEVGEKPTLEGCEYDTERFETEYISWQQRGQQARDLQHKQEQAQRARNETFERARGKYQARAGELRIAGFEQAEQAIIDTLGPDFLGAMIQYADDAPKLVGALGRNQAMLARVAAEDDPIMRLKMLLKAEAKIVTKRKAPPEPEAGTIQRGTAPVSRASADKRLAKLEADAEKTGDRSEIIRYRAQQRSAGK